MSAKIYGSVVGLLFCCASVQAYGACDQVSPNPNPAGGTVNNVSANGCAAGDLFVNSGTLNNAGLMEGAFENDGTINNTGQIGHRDLTNFGVVNNSGIITNGPDSHGAELLNRGIINNSGVLINNGTILTNEGTLINSGTIKAVNDAVANFGLLINTGQIFSGGGIQFYNEGVVINDGQIYPYNGPGTLGNYIQTDGAMVVNGTMEESSVVIIGGALQGTGIVISSAGSNPFVERGVEINGGTINSGAYGVGIGKLTIDGDLTFNSGMVMTEIAGSAVNDMLKVTDAASFLAGTFTFSFLNGYLPGVGVSWTFLEAAGGITGWENLALAYSGVPSNYLFSVSEHDNSLVLSVAAVPEPEVYASMALGLAMLGFLRHRQRAKASAKRNTI